MEWNIIHHSSPLLCSTVKIPVVFLMMPMLFFCASKFLLLPVQIFLANGANVDAAQASGGTPLYVAAQNGHAQCLKVRLKNGGYLKTLLQPGFCILLCLKL